MNCVDFGKINIRSSLNFLWKQHVRIYQEHRIAQALRQGMLLDVPQGRGKISGGFCGLRPFWGSVCPKYRVNESPNSDSDVCCVLYTSRILQAEQPEKNHIWNYRTRRTTYRNLIPICPYVCFPSWFPLCVIGRLAISNMDWPSFLSFNFSFSLEVIGRPRSFCCLS